MFERIRRLLKSETAADIRAALAEIDLEKLRSDLAAANANRTRLLLEGSDSQVLAAEKAAETARLALDRGEAAHAELGTKLATAIAKEFDEAFMRQWTEADAEAQATVDFIRSKVVPAVRVIDEAFAKMHASDEKIRAVRTVIHRHINDDNAAGQATTPSWAVSRLLSTPDLLPGWLLQQFERRSLIH